MRGVLRHMQQSLVPRASFASLLQRPYRYLYAGDVPDTPRYSACIGLSLTQANANHIRHDILEPFPLPDGCVDLFQAEDVFEHIALTALPAVIDEIHRVLKPGGVFRCSMPDYGCDLLRNRTLYDVNGRMAFDPHGGGAYVDGRVVGGGHIWFPRFEAVKQLFSSTRFEDVSYYHYYDQDGTPVMNQIDYSIAHVARTPDHDSRVQSPRRPLSIVLDARK